MWLNIHLHILVKVTIFPSLSIYIPPHSPRSGHMGSILRCSHGATCRILTGKRVQPGTRYDPSCANMCLVSSPGGESACNLPLPPPPPTTTTHTCTHNCYCPATLCNYGNHIFTNLCFSLKRSPNQPLVPCMYACVYHPCVCIYVCVCMYVCMYVCNVCICRWYMYMYIYVCMYVCSSVKCVTT